MMHGGTLTAESKGKNKGSTFTLRLPVGNDQGAHVSGNGEASHADVTGALLEVLIIEDNVDAAEMLVVLLESMGHAVRVAHDGPAGLEMMNHQQPDVVLCDIGLPGMDGNEVCRRVRATIGGEVVMVALTGWGMEEDRKQTSAAGFDHHLVKPADFEIVREVLRAAATKRIAR
jgi:CheY-like chemotaxis protein